MTDNEIIKALDSVGTATGVALGHHSGKADIIADRFRNLIDENNRQKAEIERLEKEKDSKIVRCIANDKDKIKSEAIKEFAERLKKYLCLNLREGISVVTNDNIDKLVKEMTGQI